MAAKVASSPYARGGAPAAQAWPPGPPGLPILGNLLGLARDPLAFYTDCAERYGDIVGMRLGGWPALLLNQPDAGIELVLVKQHRSFVRNSFFWRHVTAVFGQGLLTSEGEFWLRQRRLAAPAFSGTRLNAMARSWWRYAGAMLSRLEGRASPATSSADTMGLTLRIAAEYVVRRGRTRRCRDIQALIGERSRGRSPSASHRLVPSFPYRAVAGAYLRIAAGPRSEASWPASCDSAGQSRRPQRLLSNLMYARDGTGRAAHAGRGRFGMRR